MTLVFGFTLLAFGILGGQTFDKSANGSFKGNYYLRQVLLSGIDANTGAIGRSRSLIGTATLDGAGNYTFTGTLMDSQGSSPQAFSATGTVAVAANGLFQMKNPLEPKAFVDGGVGLGAFTGSSTESTFQDFLVMIPAGTAGVTNNSLVGSYRVGTLDFLQALFSHLWAAPVLARPNSSRRPGEARLATWFTRFFPVRPGMNAGKPLSSTSAEERLDVDDQPPRYHEWTHNMREENRQGQPKNDVPPHTTRALHHLIDSPENEERKQCYRQKRIASNISGRDFALAAPVEIYDIRFIPRGVHVAAEGGQPLENRFRFRSVIALVAVRCCHRSVFLRQRPHSMST